MIKFLKWFLGLFSQYVNSFERKVDRFFKYIKSTDNIFMIKKQLLALMQENLIVTNVWMEKKYKGYKYLDKGTRRKMYEDVLKIIQKFEENNKTYEFDDKTIKEILVSKSLSFSNADGEKIKYLAQIMSFLKPGQYYHYIKTASFGKLLRDPDQEKLEGDCNQIVTLYVYLYSLKFPIEDLQIKLLSEHVCLHFKGIDIEATNGTFQKYVECRDVLPVTEIISTNLLDLTDFREEVQRITPQIMVKSSQLAFAVSSLRSLVAKNLNIAYKNLAIAAMNANEFETAIFYFEKSGDQGALKSVYHNAALYFMKQNNFEKAKFFADKNGDPAFLKTVKYNEGVYCLNNENVDRALEIFSGLNDDKMKKACYTKMYNKLADRVSGVRTLEDAKKYKSTYVEMLDLAQKIGDNGLVNSVKTTLKGI